VPYALIEKDRVGRETDLSDTLTCDPGCVVQLVSPAFGRGEDVILCSCQRACPL
jgi:hypothetical protein